MLRIQKSEMKFILTSKSWSFAINRATAIAEVVVAAEAAAAVVPDIVAVVITTTTVAVWVDQAHRIMATVAVVAVVVATAVAVTIGIIIVEILTCQIYNR